MTDTKTGPVVGFDAEHTEASVAHCRQMAATHRSYLEWSQDPDVRIWAESVAAAYDQMAEAEGRLASAIRLRDAEAVRP